MRAPTETTYQVGVNHQTSEWSAHRVLNPFPAFVSKEPGLDYSPGCGAAAAARREGARKASVPDIF